MKRFLTLMTVVAIAVAAYCANRMQTVFTLDHQMQPACEKKIKTNLRFEKGVSNIDVSLKENTITIEYASKKTDDAALIKAFKKIGFNARVVTPAREMPSKKR